MSPSAMAYLKKLSVLLSLRDLIRARALTDLAALIADPEIL